MTTRPTPDNHSDSTPSRSEIENALSGRTKRNIQTTKRPKAEPFDLSVPPRRQQVIGGKLGGVSKRNKFGVFSRYSDIRIVNWVALGVVALILAVFFWPSIKDPTKEIDSPEQLSHVRLGETDLSETEQADLLKSENKNPELSFSRTSDIDRAKDFREQEVLDTNIRTLLDQAKNHISKGLYTQPANNNATAAYKQILVIAPNNVAAKQGIEFIKSRFLDIGYVELENNKLSQAEKTLQKIASINPKSDAYNDLSNAIDNWKTQNKIKQFNEKGASALKTQNFILPAKENSLYYFKQALQLNPNDETALEGIQEVANNFVQQANESILAGQSEAAAAHLSTISIIDPEHESISSLEELLAAAIALEAQAASENANASTSDNNDNLAQSNPNQAQNRQTLEQQTFDKQYLKQGLEAYYQGEYLKAAALLQPLADKGIARAQFRLAYMHYLGRGFTQDTNIANAMIKTAMPAIQKFADDNRAWAQSDLGSLYEDGLVLERDFNQAVAWYRSAAEQGYPGAQTNLGIMYARGRGVSVNRKIAIEWFRKAANQGDNAAKRNLIALGVQN